MLYEVTIIDVKDADAIVINYHDGLRWWTSVVDAGNVGDGLKVKSYIKHREDGKCIIDYAFCTHPDKDHKGGFFDLLTDKQTQICNFIIRRPDIQIRNDSRRLQFKTGELEKAAKAVYNHPTDVARNLIDESIKYSNLREPNLGENVPGMPLMVIGPQTVFFQNACYEMALNFSEIKDEPDTVDYAVDILPTEEEAKSVMDETKEESATNKSSMILLFQPEIGCNFLLAGDACSASLKDAINLYPDSIPGCIFKVPHHGSKRNLTTEIIEMIRPSSAVISCRGSRKHPNPAVVHFLSRYCDVYSTSKCDGSLTYKNTQIDNPAIPLRRKQ